MPVNYLAATLHSYCNFYWYFGQDLADAFIRGERRDTSQLSIGGTDYYLWNGFLMVEPQNRFESSPLCMSVRCVSLVRVSPAAEQTFAKVKKSSIWPPH